MVTGKLAYPRGAIRELDTAAVDVPRRRRDFLPSRRLGDGRTLRIVRSSFHAAYYTKNQSPWITNPIPHGLPPDGTQIGGHAMRMPLSLVAEPGAPCLLSFIWISPCVVFCEYRAAPAAQGNEQKNEE